MIEYPSLYLSRPGVAIPAQAYSNAAVLDMVHSNYRGAPEGWPKLEAAIKRVFDMCNTQTRYLDFDPNSRIAAYSAEAARSCLESNNVYVDEIDLIISCGIAREYFEPATAMEVASILGIDSVHAFDITSACVGHLEGIQAACAYLTMHENFRTALVCTAELTRDFLSFDLQSTNDLYKKAAGLTVGNAAAAVLVRKQPFDNGCTKLVSTRTFGAPHHWDICTVPIKGTFESSSVEIIKLHTYVIPRIGVVLDSLGWAPGDVAYYLFHQPSESVTRKVIEGAGADGDRGIYTHHLYGNNASATMGVVYDHLLKEKQLSAGDKILFVSAAAGFVMVTVAGEWVD